MRGMVCVLRQATVVAGLCLALATLGDPVEAVTCRQGPLAASKYCTLPEGLGNFQGTLLSCPHPQTLNSGRNKVAVFLMVAGVRLNSIFALQDTTDAQTAWR